MIGFDDEFVVNFTMMNSMRRKFNMRGFYEGYYGKLFIMYTKFLREIDRGMKLPDAYVYLKQVNNDKFHELVFDAIERYRLGE